VALLDLATGSTTLRVVTSFPAVLALPEAPVVIGVDMPIGLLDAAERGGRECDRLARGRLGQPRARSVFSPPARGALPSQKFPEACMANRASSPLGIGISQQCFHIFSKMREVDGAMSPAAQTRVFEVHPELTFFEMRGGTPMTHAKKASEGRKERVRTLANAGILRPGASVPNASAAAPDDVLDALAACWTARRIHLKEAVRVPDWPPVDGRGLRMEIWR
jgi:predicted RNase H-like nuclease